MSKVFIVRFSRYSIYKVQCRSQLAAEHKGFYHNFFALSSTFFMFFQTFLWALFEALQLCAAAPDSLHILSRYSSFVKCFFQVFTKFFLMWHLLLFASDPHILAECVLNVNRVLCTIKEPLPRLLLFIYRMFYSTSSIKPYPPSFRR